MLEVRDEKVMWGLVVIPRIVGFFSRGKGGIIKCEVRVNVGFSFIRCWESIRGFV